MDVTFGFRVSAAALTLLLVAGLAASCGSDTPADDAVYTIAAESNTVEGASFAMREAELTEGELRVTIEVTSEAWLAHTGTPTAVFGDRSVAGRYVEQSPDGRSTTYAFEAPGAADDVELILGPFLEITDTTEIRIDGAAVVEREGLANEFMSTAYVHPSDILSPFDGDAPVLRMMVVGEAADAIQFTVRGTFTRPEHLLPLSLANGRSAPFQTAGAGGYDVEGDDFGVPVTRVSYTFGDSSAALDGNYRATLASAE